MLNASFVVMLRQAAKNNLKNLPCARCSCTANLRGTCAPLQQKIPPRLLSVLLQLLSVKFLHRALRTEKNYFSIKSKPPCVACVRVCLRWRANPRAHAAAKSGVLTKKAPWGLCAKKSLAC
jgi:hypothetical protein